MVKIIETNLSMKDSAIVDHQSRVIEVDHWESYINELRNMESVYRTSALGSLHGVSLPLKSRVENLTYDENHLSCDVYNRFGMMTKKLAYLVGLS